MLPAAAWSAVVAALVAILLLRGRRRCRHVSWAEPAEEKQEEEEAVAQLGAEQLMQSVEAMRAHARDDRLLEAGDLLKSLRLGIASAPGSKAAKAAAAELEEEVRPGMSASELRRRHTECKETLRLLRRPTQDDGGDGDGGWRLLSRHDGTETFVRRSADGMLWAKATGEVGGGGGGGGGGRGGGAPPVPLMRVLALFREVQLFREWYPHCVESETLAAPAQCERLFRMVMSVRVPLFGTVRYDLVPHAYGVDALEGHGCFVVCGRSATQLEWLRVAFPRPPEGGARQQLAALRLVITPLPGGRTHASVATAVDLSKTPAAALLPQWTIDWLISHIIGKLFSAQAACAQRMHDAPEASAHLRAIAADGDFYDGWLQPRVDAAVEAAERGAAAAEGEWVDVGAPSDAAG